MNRCLHQFFKTNKEVHYPKFTPPEGGGIFTSLPDKSGVRVICALCGEIRILWDTGEIEIKPTNKQRSKG